METNNDGAENHENDGLAMLPGLRKALLLEIEKALKQGGRSSFFEATERLRSGDALLEQVASLWRGKQTPLSATHQDQSDDSPFGNYISEKKRGESARSRWIADTKLGTELTRIKGALYRNRRGEIVGIAYAKETEKRKGRWFSGLQAKKFVPDQRFQSVVLLCEAMSGKLNAVCLPRDFVAKYREKFSKSHGQVKFMVVKRAEDWLLSVPGVPDVPVTGNVNNPALVV